MALGDMTLGGLTTLKKENGGNDAGILQASYLGVRKSEPTRTVIPIISSLFNHPVTIKKAEGGGADLQDILNKDRQSNGLGTLSFSKTEKDQVINRSILGFCLQI